MPEKREQTMTARNALITLAADIRGGDVTDRNLLAQRVEAIARALPTPAPTMVDEREAFEAAMAAEGYELNPARYRDGTYRSLEYAAGWAMWRARPTLQSLGGDAGAPVDFSDDFVEHSHPQYGSGFFCTPDVFDRIAALSLTSTEKSDGVVRDMPKYVSDAEWEAGSSTLPAAPKAAEKIGRSE